ncbi:hypothetical protein AVEN_58298-1 [Araneus ventricosus]|uniref:Uncharacterized protein n=1 Tax=Araneus ventricosus TaxID=182803 RepID=A0A4Y2CRB3_ARAVE|nr:hypothetical protein AVEN_58298-1 [Araneus ventricosus]
MPSFQRCLKARKIAIKRQVKNYGSNRSREEKNAPSGEGSPCCFYSHSSSCTKLSINNATTDLRIKKSLFSCIHISNRDGTQGRSVRDHLRLQDPRLRGMELEKPI